MPEQAKHKTTDPAAQVLGSSARGTRRPLAYLPEAATPDQRERARASALYAQGDMRLVWVSEGDLCNLIATGEAVSYGKR